jgi:uncharacterized membrane protein
MKELESLLPDIPIEEKEEALRYYHGYFEDAGEDREDDIIKELGSPKKVAAIIKAELDTNYEDRENRGYFTEKGYQDNIYKDEKFELVGTHSTNSKEQYSTDDTSRQGNQQSTNYNSTNNQDGNGTYKQNTYQDNNQRTNQNTQNKNTNIVLIILLCIFAIPVGIPLVFSIFGMVVGIIGSILGIIVGFGVAGIAMIIAGIAVFFVGLVQLSVPMVGLLFCGGGLLVFGLGMLFTLFSGFLCKKVLPALIQGFVNLCRLPFKNRRVVA